MENFGQPESVWCWLWGSDLKESVTSSFGKFAVRFPAITWALPWAYKFLWSLVVWIISWRAMWLKASVYNWKLKSLMNILLKNMFKQYTFSYNSSSPSSCFPPYQGGIDHIRHMPFLCVFSFPGTTPFLPALSPHSLPGKPHHSILMESCEYTLHDCLPISPVLSILFIPTNPCLW